MIKVLGHRSKTFHLEYQMFQTTKILLQRILWGLGTKAEKEASKEKENKRKQGQKITNSLNIPLAIKQRHLTASIQ